MAPPDQPAAMTAAAPVRASAERLTTDGMPGAASWSRISEARLRPGPSRYRKPSRDPHSSEGGCVRLEAKTGIPPLVNAVNGIQCSLQISGHDRSSAPVGHVEHAADEL